MKYVWLALVMVAGAALAMGLVPGASQAQQQPPREPWWAPRTSLGITAVEDEHRDRSPIGRGITAVHVEGMGGDYLPDRRKLQRARFLPMSGGSHPNAHATQTARILYGPGSLAPGITDVHCYAIGHWLGEGFLHTGEPRAPQRTDRRLFNHSWIAGGRPTDAQALRRVDHVIDTQDVIMVVGVNNGRDTPVPPLLASAYNVIAVGSRNSSGGYTRIEGDGRCKPDIIAHTPRTSFATPMVAAVAGRLLEMGDNLVAEAVAATEENDADAPKPAAAFANKSQVIRAVLYAGARKVRWKAEEGKPLDQFQGFGRVRMDHSHAIMSQPLPSMDAPLPTHGWHYAVLSAGEEAVYHMSLPERRGEWHIALVWNRRIDGRMALDPVYQRPLWMDVPRMADLDLHLERRSGDGEWQIVDQSLSRIDNIEHIFQRRMRSGEYRLRITRHDELDETWDYALAWRLEPWPVRDTEEDDDDEPEEAEDDSDESLDEPLHQ